MCSLIYCPISWHDRHSTLESCEGGYLHQLSYACTDDSSYSLLYGELWQFPAKHLQKPLNSTIALTTTTGFKIKGRVMPFDTRTLPSWSRTTMPTHPSSSSFYQWLYPKGPFVLHKPILKAEYIVFFFFFFLKRIWEINRNANVTLLKK